MATSRSEMFDTLEHAKENKKQWDAGVTFNRLNPVPLDKYSVFKTYAEASAYALTGSISYPGQPLAVVGDPEDAELSGTTLYLIEADGSLKKLASGGDADEVLNKLNAEIARAKAAELALSGDLYNHVSIDLDTLEDSFSTLTGTTLPNKYTEISTGLSVTVEQIETTAGSQATYVVKQNGEQAGAKIEIPRDKVISSAYMVDVTGNKEGDELTSFTVKYDSTTIVVKSDDTTEGGETVASGTFASIKNAYNGKEGGNGPYLRISVSNQDCPIYIAMPKVVDTYTGLSTDTISVDVSNRQIKAIVRDSSISATHLASDSVTTAKIADGNVTKAKLNSDVTTWGEELSSTAYNNATAYVDGKIEGLDSEVSVGLDGEIQQVITAVVETDGKLTQAKSYKLQTKDIEGLATKFQNLSTALTNDFEGRIGGLDSSKSVNSTERVTRIYQENGLVSAEVATMTLDNVSGWETTLNEKYDAIGSASTAESNAKSYADDKIAALDKTVTNDSAGKTVSQLIETDGVVSATFQAIEITKDQVTGLTSTLSTINDVLTGDVDGSVNKRIDARAQILSGYAEAQAASAQSAAELSAQAVRNDLESDYVKYANVKGGKEAITNDNLIVTQQDIAALTGVMHFKGVALNDELSTGSKTIPIPPYKSGDTPISGDVVIDKNGTEFIWAVSADSEGVGKWYKIGDENLYLKKAEFETWKDTTYESRVSGIEDDITSLESNVTTLQTKSDEISGKVDHKVKVGIGTFDGTTWTDTLTDKTTLSVVKIDDEDYYKLVSAGKQNDDVLYIVSSDNVNGHDQRIINVGTPISSTDAVNLSAMNAAIKAATDDVIANQLSAIKLNDQDFTFNKETHTASLSIEVISCGGAF